jgi:hypothetical protein
MEVDALDSPERVWSI